MADSRSGTSVVLVHGAFADAGSWAPVTERLIAAGVPVTAIVNPLRGIASDAAYVASFINQIDGPVLAVGHSYGGAIITNAVSRTTNVVGLVYVAAFARADHRPDQVPGRLQRRPAPARVRRLRALPAPDRRRRARGTDHQGGLEGSADLGCRGNRRRRRRVRRRALHGPARRRSNHRDRRISRDHDLSARRGHRCHPDGT